MKESSDYPFKFSIIMASYNVEDYLDEAIDSICNQTIGFKENVQLIIVDDGSFDKSYNIAKEYQEKYPDNILVFKKENGGQASARNYGLNYACGKYLNFLDSDDYLSKNALEEVYKFFEDNYDEIDLLAIPMVLFERVNGPHRLNYKFDKGNRIIDLIEEPNNPILSSSSSFIKSESFEGYRFDENLVNLEDALIINKILLEKKKYGVINTCNYYYRQRTVKSSTVDTVNMKKGYYTDRLINFYKNIIDYPITKENEVPLFIQYLMAYDLQWLLKMPNLDVFDSKEEVQEFWKILYYVIGHIDKNVVIDNPNIEDDSRSFFIFLLNNDNSSEISKNFAGSDDKNGLNFEPTNDMNDFNFAGSDDINDFNEFKNIETVELADGHLLKKTNDYIIDKIDIHRIWLDIVEIKKNSLKISGMFISNFNDDHYKIRVVKKSRSENGSKKEFRCQKIKYNTPERNTRPYLGHDWKYILNFDVEIPLTNGEISDLEFIVDYDDGEVSFSFEALLGLNHNLGLSEYSAYFAKNHHIVLYKDLRLHIVNYSYLAMIRYEYSNIKRALKIKPSFYKSSLVKKLIYYMMYPFMKNKRIWIFSDRPDFADDNAMHLFKYAIGQNDNVKKYFAVNEDSPSFELMKNISKKGSFKSSVVPFASLKHNILYLFAEKAISSYTNEDFINPFFEHDNRDLYAGLFTTERLFLQHGVTKDDISRFVKKYNNNLSLIVTVSDLERESFLKEGYNYDESIIPVLGFPRYDNLKNDNVKKQILFMPTWRQIDGKDAFIESDYYKSLNSFLNNKDLIDLLDEFGFDLIFKPHIEMMDFLELLNIDEKVILSLDKSYKNSDLRFKNKIIFNDSYQDLFNKSSILITDYSSVFFDFAYLKKPVIYYQSNKDYHYDEGYFDYDNMGFGEVISDVDVLLSKIRYYLNNDCMMEDKFKERVDQFFKFNDNKNCERVYKWILKN